ncbi:hypothetical protein F6J84_11910 [Microbacterium caowuchunii]|uniref:cell division protein PerM n=1 Tax=Microbacterium caowuchunii TaxID=2614638 RepID=UPI0012466738|nr:DUF6350 family protein [Microbacterium caowuchunii]QEW00735.1 hypothetical protein F6J84_11910 [Microbacterium caowuchunii]
MHRVLVSLLSALDSLVAAAVGVAVAVAPLTILWIVVFGALDLGAVWQTSAAIWQLGHAVPLHVTLPDLYLAQTGIDPALAGFAVSLPPLGFAAFTFLFAARSGARAARSGAWVTGVVTGLLVFTAFATLVAITGAAALVRVELWQAILFPSAFYGVGVLGGAVRVAWSDGDDGIIDELRTRLDTRPGAWPEFPSLAARGGAIVLTSLSGIAALALAVVLVVRGPQIVALSQSANLDGLGAVVMGLGQILYLPTLIVWALAFVAGPGVALGAGAVVAPGGTQLGILPGIPILGVLPESTSPWLLALVLLPVAAGAFAGWAVRSRLSPRGGQADAESTGLLIALTATIGVLAALGAALLAVLASGALGPGRLGEVGPDPAALALAIGIEVGLGAGILLLAPRRRPGEETTPTPDAATPGRDGWSDEAP